MAAPSKLQRPAGDRVKTDAKDAVHLARLLRLGELSPVTVPSVNQEAARDLVRAREDCRGDLIPARHRLSRLLLLGQGIVYSGGQAWTGAHDAWLRRQRFDNPATQLALESDYDAVLAVSARRDRLDTAINDSAADSEFTPVVRRLACLRGVSTLTAFALAVEIGDWHRFSANSIGSFLGLVPSQHSSGASKAPGSITKDRQHPPPPAARRSHLAPARATGHLQPTTQTPRHRQPRHHPRTHRLVLVAGRPRLRHQLSPPKPLPHAL